MAGSLYILLSINHPSTMMTKDQLIQTLVRGKYLRTPLIIEAFKQVDRRDFVLLEYEKEAYENHPLPIGFGQTISQPLTVAFMLELLEPRPGEKILEVGAGSGWQTALLAYCISKNSASSKPRGKLFAIERIPELKEMAEENISKYNFIKKGIINVILGDGSKGHPAGAPYDKIITAAAAEHVMVAWKEQLCVGGRIVAPVGNSIEVHDKLSPTDYNVQEYRGFSFVPLISREEGGGE
jgi:protein-L-isoaspartate(D-aspartate) O-methyltransferase